MFCYCGEEFIQDGSVLFCYSGDEFIQDDSVLFCIQCGEKFIQNDSVLFYYDVVRSSHIVCCFITVW